MADFSVWDKEQIHRRDNKDFDGKEVKTVQVQWEHREGKRGNNSWTDPYWPFWRLFFLVFRSGIKIRLYWGDSNNLLLSQQ